METFAWLQSHSIEKGVLTLSAGPGHVTMRPAPGSYASVLELVHSPGLGALLSATAVARLHCKGECRYVLLQRDLGAAVSPGAWQIPAGRCSPDENPNDTAVRELREEVGLSAGSLSWDAAVVRTGSAPVVFQLQQGTLEFEGQWAYHHNTYEFYATVDLEVSSFEQVELFDLEYGRKVALFTASELLAMYDQGQLADGSVAVVSALLAAGQLQR